MSGRYEITNREDGISITSPDGIVDQLIASDPEDGQCLDDAVIGAIRQQARDLDQLRIDLAAAVAKRDEWASGAARLSSQLGNLLAVIHRDGGHYESEHGTEKACADAETAVHVQRGIADGYHDALKIWRQRAEQAESRLAAIEAAPTVALVEGGDGFRYLSWGQLPPVDTQLIARPAKDQT